MIYYLKHNEINKQKWDEVISLSAIPLVYASSWYLDVVSPGWDALVLDDYTMVMPVTRKIKYGVKYVIQPAFTQQLGFFCKTFKEEVASEFVTILSKRFRYININLNYQNYKNVSRQYDLRINSVLNLNKSYEFINKNFNTNTKRNIKKASNENLRIVENINYLSIFDFKKNNAIEEISNKNYRTLFKLLKKANELDKGFGAAVYNSSNNLLSAAYFIKEFDRIIFLVSVSNDEGKEKSAMFLLVDYLIRKYAGQNYILDFEGGTLSGIRKFFEGFGASRENYLNLVINNLPWPLKLVKK